MWGKKRCNCRASVHNLMRPTGRRRTRRLEGLGGKLAEVEYGCEHGARVWLPSNG